jgi:hypothetical protein
MRIFKINDEKIMLEMHNGKIITLVNQIDPETASESSAN